MCWARCFREGSLVVGELRLLGGRMWVGLGLRVGLQVVVVGPVAAVEVRHMEAAAVEVVRGAVVEARWVGLVRVVVGISRRSANDQEGCCKRSRYWRGLRMSMPRKGWRLRRS